MTMTKKIWIIEADNDECWDMPIIKYSAKEAEDYVRSEFDSALIDSPNFSYDWEIENGIGTASIYDGYGSYYNWRITEHEVEYDYYVAYAE